MIWIDIKRLEKEIATDRLSDKEGFNYLLATMLLFSVAPYTTSTSYENHWLTWIAVSADIFITMLLVRSTFEINTNGDNKDYFKRFISLSFVTTIRLAILVAIAAFSVVMTTHFIEKSVDAHEFCNEFLIVVLTHLAGNRLLF